MSSKRAAVETGVSNFLRQAKGRAVPAQGTGGREGQGAELDERQPRRENEAMDANASAGRREDRPQFGRDIIDRALNGIVKAPRTKSLTVRLTERDFYRLKVLSLASGKTILDIGESAILEWIRQQERSHSGSGAR